MPLEQSYVLLGIALNAGSWADWFSGIATAFATVVALSSYIWLDQQRRIEERQKRQDSAYQIGYKLATLISEAMATSKNLYPEGTTPEDWRNVTDPFEIFRTQQPAVGFAWSMTRDLTDAEQNLLMKLREEEFLMDMTETYARNQTIREGVLAYKDHYTVITDKMPLPIKIVGSVASYETDASLEKKLFPYATQAGSLMRELRKQSQDNIDLLRKMGSEFHGMMQQHYPDLHIHKIEEVTQQANNLAGTSAIGSEPAAPLNPVVGALTVRVSYD